MFWATFQLCVECDIGTFTASEQFNSTCISHKRKNLASLKIKLSVASFQLAP